MEQYNIDGNKDLARDPITNAIININELNYDQYVSIRKLKNKKNQVVDTIEEDINDLKNEINEIKSLLKELVHGN
jgi:hypothetical protein